MIDPAPTPDGTPVTPAAPPRSSNPVSESAPVPSLLPRPPFGSGQWQRHIPHALLVVLRDRYMWALVIVALVVNLALFGFLIFEFTRVPAVLPPLIPLHFDANGDPDRIEPLTGLFTLAQIGLVVIVGNLGLGALIYRRERLATYLLGAVGVVVQLLLWFAAIQIIRAVAL